MAKTVSRPPRQRDDARARQPRSQQDDRTASEPAIAPRPAFGAGLLSRVGPAEGLILLAIVVAAFLRLSRLGDVPLGLNQDEAVSGYDAYSLFLTGRDHLGHPFTLAGLESFGDWVSPVLTALTIPAVALFGLTTETLRVVSALVGILAVPLIAWLATELFSRRAIGVVAAWLIALSPWHIHQSRWAIPPVMVPTMVIALLLACVWALRRRSGPGVIIAAVVAGLTIASYPTMKLYVPLLLLAAAIAYWRDLLGLPRAHVAYAALAFMLIAGPIYYLSTRDPGGRARLELVSVFRDKQGQVGPGLLWKQYASYFSPDFLFVKGDGSPMHSPPGFGVEPRALAPLLLIGLLCLLYGAVRPLVRRAAPPWPAWLRPQAAWLILLALVCYPIPGSLTVPNPHTLRGIHLLPLLALLGAVGTIAVAEPLARLVAGRRATRAQGRQVAIVQGLLALLLLVPSAPELSERYRAYVTTYPSATARDFQYGLLEAFTYARAREQNYDEIWVSDANQPYIYLLFATRWPPSKVHTDLKLWRPPPYANQIAEFGKYRFGTPNGVNRNALPVVETIRTPAGAPSLLIRAGLANQRRILLIHRP